ISLGEFGILSPVFLAIQITAITLSNSIRSSPLNEEQTKLTAIPLQFLIIREKKFRSNLEVEGGSTNRASLVSKRVTSLYFSSQIDSRNEKKGRSSGSINMQMSRICPLNLLIAIVTMDREIPRFHLSFTVNP
ncbi:hypothetical protein PFISCL1PPCAC_18968, partial [Pristionchus fissidentatus]